MEIPTWHHHNINTAEGKHVIRRDKYKYSLQDKVSPPPRSSNAIWNNTQTFPGSNLLHTPSEYQILSIRGRNASQSDAPPSIVTLVRGGREGQINPLIDSVGGLSDVPSRTGTQSIFKISDERLDEPTGATSNNVWSSNQQALHTLMYEQRSGCALMNLTSATPPEIYLPHPLNWAGH